MQDNTNRPSNDNRLLSRKEVAQHLRVSESTLATWKSTDRYPLRFIKVGRLVRYRACDVHDFIQSRTVDPASQANKSQ